MKLFHAEGARVIVTGSAGPRGELRPRQRLGTVDATHQVTAENGNRR
jgi:hypothetical protein